MRVDDIEYKRMLSERRFWQEVEKILGCEGKKKLEISVKRS